MMVVVVPSGKIGTLRIRMHTWALDKFPWPILAVVVVLATAVAVVTLTAVAVAVMAVAVITLVALVAMVTRIAAPVTRKVRTTA